MNRPFEEKFYNDFIKMVDLQFLPDNWQDFQNQLCFPEKITLSEIEKMILWQSGTCFKVSVELIQNPSVLKLIRHATQTAALQLILYGVFIQLRSWEHKFSELENNRDLLSNLITYLTDKKLKYLRHSLAHCGDDNFDTYWYFDANTQSVIFSCRDVRKLGKTNETMSLHEVVFAAFLWWVLVSEWCSIGLENENT